jgi:hypothetical protein
MSEVWKFPLALIDNQVVAMPEGSDLLHVGEQYGTLTLWARVTPTGQREVDRLIIVRGTGHPIFAQPHVGTVLMPNGLVWHVFDGGEEEK